MTWSLERFGEIVLPIYDPSTPAGTGPSRESTTGTPDGAFDHLGDDRAALDLPYDLPYRATVAEATGAAQLATVRVLKGMRGRPLRLYRRVSDGSVEWCWARLRRVSLTEEYGQGGLNQLDFLWTVQSPWYGVHHTEPLYFDDGVYFDDAEYFDLEESHPLSNGSNSITVTNDGDTDATNVVITVTAGTGTIDSIKLTISGVAEIQWAGALATRKKLVISAGAKRVTNDGADAASGFLTTANHKSNFWLPLAPGDNTITVLVDDNGSDSTILFDFSEPME
jgi:hypothetical protein